MTHENYPINPVIKKDSRSGSLISMDIAHAEIHAGDYWYADDISASLSTNDVKYWLFVTPDEARYFHSFPQLTGTGEFEFQVYEAGTATGNGTEIALLNRDRNSTNTTTFKFYKDPTGTGVSGATVVRTLRTGAGKSVGESRSENELILKSNTKYLVKATARANGIYITLHVNGYITG